MNDSQEIRYFFVRRPVLAMVISIVITLLGLFALQRLPVNRYPNISPPTISVTAFYPGASSEDVARAVAAPIEEQLSGLQGLLYYKSSNSSSGAMSLSLLFDISRDPDLAAIDVQNAVKLAEPQLPEEVRRQGIIVQKAQSDILLVGALTSTSARYDASYLSNYGKLYLEDELKRLPGVGNAQFFGQLQFAMRLGLDPDRMAQLGLTVGDVIQAVQEQNTTNPAGRLGREPAPAGTQFTLPVTTQGRLTTPAEFDSIIVRTAPDASLVRLGDIATVTLGSQDYDAVGRLSGHPTAFFLVYLRAGANALQVKKAVAERMDELAAKFPSGVSWSLPYDTTLFISASVDEVVKTLAEAMLLVTLVVFVFLQSWRATLIPILAVPVSVIGTFLGLQFLGFSINVLTLFGLVLAIGIVVDDAIVVIENVERIMADEGVGPRVAADRAMRQVAGALIAIVISLCAVFIPVAFVGGITGALYKQFAITIVIAVVLSGIVALTLTPALCALLLRKREEDEPEHGPFGWFNRGFHRARRGYTGAVGRVLGYPKTVFAVFAVLLALTWVLWNHIPHTFLPEEDKGFIALAVQLPDGASRQRTERVVGRVEQIVLHDPGVQEAATLVGLDILTQATKSNAATMFIKLKPWDERGAKNLQVSAILGRLNGQLFGMRDALAFSFNFPEVPGLGTTAGLEMNLENTGGSSLQTFSQQVNAFVVAANQLPEVGGLRTVFSASEPQVRVTVDRAAAKARGVNLSALFQTMQAMLSSVYINDFNLYGRTYRVQAEAQPRFRQTPADIGRLYVRSATTGDMIPLSALTHTEFTAGPGVLTRFNGFTSALVTGAPAPGKSTAEMMSAIEHLIASRFAGQGIGYGYSGQSFQEKASGEQGATIMILGLVLVFLVLAAQYESWSIPFAVLLGIPFGALGALLGVYLRGMTIDVYFQVGLITVVGLAAKNAILIVEFASELRGQGRSIAEAAVEAARERFRPILMTSFAFILGVAPLVIASGPGAASRHSIGTGVFAGMLFATTIGIFFIPSFFAVIRGASERGLFRRRAANAGEPAREGA